MIRSFALLGCLAVIGVANRASAVDPIMLMKYIPTPVNTVAVVNVAAILNTPRAMKEGWSKLDHTEYLAGAVPINPSIERILLASEFVPTHPGHGGGLAIAPLKKAANFEKLAKSLNGELTTVASGPAVATRSGSFLVPLGPELLGAIRTPHKPDAARWVKYAQTADKSVQPLYLRQAVSGFGTKFHILVALDTEDLIHPDQARAAVAMSKLAMAEKKISVAVEKYVIGLTGVRFTANIEEGGIAATIRVDSSVTPTMPPDVMKGFIIETLARNGAGLEDLEAATPTISANSVVLAFKITDIELAKVMSIFLTPAAGLSESDVITVAPDGVSMEASRKYYQAIGRTLDDLRGKKETGKKYDKAALWYETAATKIGTMSVLNVDKDLVQYANRVGGGLYAMSDSLRGVPIQIDQLNSQAYVYAYAPQRFYWSPWGGVRFNPWSYGGGSVQTNLGEINAKVASAVEKDKVNRDSLWAQIASDRAKVRQAMAKKYTTDFEPPPK